MIDSRAHDIEHQPPEYTARAHAIVVNPTDLLLSTRVSDRAAHLNNYHNLDQDTRDDCHFARYYAFTFEIRGTKLRLGFRGIVLCK